MSVFLRKTQQKTHGLSTSISAHAIIIILQTAMPFLIEKISLFLAKSLKGIDLDEYEVHEHMLYDRIHMLAPKKANGEWMAMTQRTEPSMVQISQEAVGGKLRISHNEKKIPNLLLSCMKNALGLLGCKLDLPLDLSLAPTVLCPTSKWNCGAIA